MLKHKESLPYPHPGEILLAEFLQPMVLSQTALARAIGVPPRRINEIVLGKRAITADTDLRLARYFGVGDGFFLQLQTDYDLMARRRQMGGKLKGIKPRKARSGERDDQVNLPYPGTRAIIERLS